jgi:branched-chain amino acid transport system substrate-binding protein
MRYFLFFNFVFVALMGHMSLLHANTVEPIKIGAIYGLTGVAAATNVHDLHGAELAVEFCDGKRRIIRTTHRIDPL